MNFFKSLLFCTIAFSSSAIFASKAKHKLSPIKESPDRTLSHSKGSPFTSPPKKSPLRKADGTLPCARELFPMLLPENTQIGDKNANANAAASRSFSAPILNTQADVKQAAETNTRPFSAPKLTMNCAASTDFKPIPYESPNQKAKSQAKARDIEQATLAQIEAVKSQNLDLWNGVLQAYERKDFPKIIQLNARTPSPFQALTMKLAALCLEK